MRKNEAAQLKREAVSLKIAKEASTNNVNHVAELKSEESSSTCSITSDGSITEQSAAGVKKKKEYKVNVVPEPTEDKTTGAGNNDKDKENVAVDSKNVVVDPAEFAKQERLRKQREKQAKFQEEINKKKQVENDKLFAENNLLVEDGDDMWDILSQNPVNNETSNTGVTSPKRKRSCTVDSMEQRKSPRIVSTKHNRFSNYNR